MLPQRNKNTRRPEGWRRALRKQMRPMWNAYLPKDNPNERVFVPSVPLSPDRVSDFREGQPLLDAIWNWFVSEETLGAGTRIAIRAKQQLERPRFSPDTWQGRIQESVRRFDNRQPKTRHSPNVKRPAPMPGPQPGPAPTPRGLLGQYRR